MFSDGADGLAAKIFMQTGPDASMWLPRLR
jgi:hypothetical protein